MSGEVMTVQVRECREVGVGKRSQLVGNVWEYREGCEEGGSGQGR